MERDWQRALAEPFDLVIIGGGINGTGAARDAARRGLRVCLLERRDFGYGTTGRSTRLIHGGLRYLAQADFGLVRESLRERERLLGNAPHLVRAIPFLVPFYKGMTPGPAKLRMGLALYDLLSYDRSVPGHRILSRDEVLDLEPNLNPEGLTGGAVYYDAQVSFVERLCVENALDAHAHGAVLLNHTEVTSLIHDERGVQVTGVTARDRLTGETGAIRGTVVLDATGPWLGKMHGDGGARVRMTKGIHLVTPPVTGHAVLLFASDGRVFFSIPWFGVSLTGTTDTDFREDVDRVHATREDVSYLQSSTRRYFPTAPLDEVAYTTAGIRALLSVEGVSESEITRRHLILDHGKHGGPQHLVSIVGGKITPFRDVTEEAVDVAARLLGVKQGSDTKAAPLPGGDLPRGDAFERYREEAARKGAARAGIPEETVAHLVDIYGSRHEAVLDRIVKDPRLGRPLCPHARDVWAQVDFAVDEELARSTGDVLLRRIPAGYTLCQAEEVAGEVAARIGERLGWSPERVREDEAAYRAELDLRRRFMHP